MTMEHADLLQALAAAGVPLVSPSYWRDSLDLLEAFDAVGRHGAVALVKIDGLRTERRYTIVLTRGEDCFHKDGDDLRTMLREALAFYATTVSRG